VAGEAGTHVVAYHSHRNRRVGQISVARCARNFSLVMGLVLKFDMRRSIEPVHSLPWNLNLLIGVVDQFLDLGLFARQFRMAQHALRHGWDARGRSDIGARVAIDTGNAHLDMGIVRERNRLFGARRKHAPGQQAYRSASAPKEPSQFPINQECSSPNPPATPCPSPRVH
jgi:hypothetical protein